VIHNILTNAVKYTPSGGTIFVETAVEDRFLTIKISDTGLGIAADDQEKIFEKFYRVPRKETEGISGSGLGLATSRMIVTLHGGTIHVVSELNKGSEFTIKLPLTSVEPVLGSAIRRGRGAP
jgi:signal transduction histidine kinase